MAKVSVIMPVYNAELYLKEAIDSILNQTFSDFEILIIEDGSTDRSKSIIFDYHDSRIKVFENKENLGVVLSRNRGIDNCTGEYIALMDADDVAPLNRLEIAVNFLNQNMEIDGVNGKIEIINESGETRLSNSCPYHNDKYLKAMLLFNNCISNGSTMFRSSFINKYNIRYRQTCGIEDYMFWCDFTMHGRMKGIDEVLQCYRINEAGLTKKSKQEERDSEIRKIHSFIYNSYGFCFSTEQLNVLLKTFTEFGQLDTKREVELLYDALHVMIQQAEEMQLDMVSELKIVCRKKFAEKISKASCLWE